ncbi:hypothetical protein [Stakelama pacifica]|uniref:Uncharacterized protein n=1 Tax=Stakelama pacifica TaxID=517720 RepID=A0A4R6FNH3_9SPHN|nr:hypothetical protein [Stakelama pacifica]TDN82987.1 hypothetical protein EV664_105185 [Stakelama pacifica]GGO94996.1 hypothetical protein GCM10011329_18140 [Stakelama pacifica]
MSGAASLAIWALVSVGPAISLGKAIAWHNSDTRITRRGVWYGSQGPQRQGVGPAPAAQSARPVFSASRAADNPVRRPWLRLLIQFEGV